jgi:hypothetical protein
MTNTKKTNREMFVTLINVIANAQIAETEKAELTDFINSRIEQLDKKANSVSKAEKEKAKLNAELAKTIIAGLTEIGKPVKVSDLIKGYEPLNEYSTQKLTPIITALVKENKVESIVVKREKLYTVKVA